MTSHCIDKPDIIDEQAGGNRGRVLISCPLSIYQYPSPITWINEDMIKAYCGLHESGFAHSVEAWHEGELAGGLYGVSLGTFFSGESMFTRVNNASKVALVFLVEYLRKLSFDMIDCGNCNLKLTPFGNPILTPH